MRLLVLGVVALLAGCDGGGGDDGGADGGVPQWPDGTLLVGTSSSSSADGFSTFGAEVNLTPGAQGGYHVETRYKISGRQVPGVTFTHAVRLADAGTLVSRGTRRFDVGDDGGDPWVSEIFPVFMCPTPVGIDVTNQQVTFEITATGSDGGTLGRANGTTRLHCEPGQYCETICKG